jgi:hypothetical protein
MLCDMSHTTCGNFFRFEVAKLPPQTRRLSAQGLADANPVYVRGIGLARARSGLVGLGPGCSPAQAKPRRAAKPRHSGVGAVGACKLSKKASVRYSWMVVYLRDECLRFNKV